MKYKHYTIYILAVIVISLLTACGMKESNNNLGAAGNGTENQNTTVENTIEATNEAVDNSTAQVATDIGSTTENITEEEAEAIALKHAGFTADEVTGLYTEYEIDDGVPEYDIKFYKDNIEYEYNIHAENGKILAFDKD